jgi:hypothetical protein
VSLRATGGSEAISPFGKSRRLLRRFAPRNDTLIVFQQPDSHAPEMTQSLPFSAFREKEAVLRKPGPGIAWILTWIPPLDPTAEAGLRGSISGVYKTIKPPSHEDLENTWTS